MSTVFMNPSRSWPSEAIPPAMAKASMLIVVGEIVGFSYTTRCPLREKWRNN